MAKMLSNFVTFLCKKHRFALIIKVHFELNSLRNENHDSI